MNQSFMFVNLWVMDLHSPKSLATRDGEIMDPEITVKLEMRDVLKVNNAQT